jgi:hypothetical protein
MDSPLNLKITWFNKNLLSRNTNMQKKIQKMVFLYLKPIELLGVQMNES